MNLPNKLTLLRVCMASELAGGGEEAARPGPPLAGKPLPPGSVLLGLCHSGRRVATEASRAQASSTDVCPCQGQLVP